MIHAPELARLPSIRHGFFTRQGGHSSGAFASLNCGYGSGDDRHIVARNRALVANRLSVPRDALLTAWQWHSADAIIARAPWDSRQPPRADAIVSDVPNLAIGILTADCAPVLFADAEAGVVAAAHAGWRGALAGVTDAAVAAMESLGARRDRIAAAVGPTISRACYEVGPEFHAGFDKADERNRRFFAPAEREMHYMFDLAAYLVQRLNAAGLGSVDDLALCTYSDESRFFSFRRATHRAEMDYGRQMSAIMLQG